MNFVDERQTRCFGSPLLRTPARRRRTSYGDLGRAVKQRVVVHALGRLASAAFLSASAFVPDLEDHDPQVDGGASVFIAGFARLA